MLNRTDLFLNLQFHPWFKKAFKKLNDKEKKIALDFIANHNHLDKGSFELAINRMFLDQEKPKNWSIILELLVASKN